MNDQRCRMAVKDKLVGRKQLRQVGTLFTPDMIVLLKRLLFVDEGTVLAEKKGSLVCQGRDKWSLIRP